MKLINIFKQLLEESPVETDKKSFYNPGYEQGKEITSKDYRDFITKSGDLVLTSTKVTSLPDGLEVDGDLRLGYELNTLPNNLKIKGDLDVSQSRISNFPKGLVIGGDLNLGYRDNVTDIPKDIVVKGTLSLPQDGFSLAKKYPVETLKKIFPNVKNIEVVAPKKF